MSVKSSAPIASTALLVAATMSTVGTAGVVRLQPAQQGRMDYRLPVDQLAMNRPIIVAIATPHVEPVADVDYGTFTDADEAMLRFAAAAGADEVDFAEFYLDDDE